MAKEISVELAKQYLLGRVGELKSQVPHGNPFIFQGIFSLMSTLAKATNNNISDVGLKMGLPLRVAHLIREQHEKFYDNFSLQVVNAPKANSNTITIYSGGNCLSNSGSGADVAKKLNLSHKDRDHLKYNPQNESITLAAAALLEDLEKGINSIFDSLTDLEKAKLYVNVNDNNQFIGYGD